MQPFSRLPNVCHAENQLLGADLVPVSQIALNGVKRVSINAVVEHANGIFAQERLFHEILQPFGRGYNRKIAYPRRDRAFFEEVSRGLIRKPAFWVGSLLRTVAAKIAPTLAVDRVKKRAMSGKGVAVVQRPDDGDPRKP
ncbi:hypothetical protein SDC9_143261 [bioreactor metagenome]|uniref:Uncharacterized protein n=1 Tax=bioreactor metagenome TaxID=1076179 RepID=A0A645E2T2_9ZZZZ